jgi:MoxR-like ATPase
MTTALKFVGHGLLAGGPWYRSEKEVVADISAFGHPARYGADEALTAAVNTALVLDKPLLVTGNPGSGKSDLAERIAWEFGLGAVERFVAQSLSEANDLFYRFDLVGRMAEGRLPTQYAAGGSAVSLVAYERTHPVHYIEPGPLGRAILRARASIEPRRTGEDRLYDALRRAVLAPDATPDAAPSPVRRSVVLIDEVDKASRDFPNDLLNDIDRTEFFVKELGLRIAAPDRDTDLHPIIIITSNQERDLPGPFLRRCVYHHIQDPDLEQLRTIVRARVFPDRRDDEPLKPCFDELTSFFFDFRADSGQRLSYTPGTAELIDVARALRRTGAQEGGSLKSNVALLAKAIGAMAKHRDDLDGLRLALDDL